ncbi:hypothetical protein ACOSQ3_018922 [Xanthoceras sorbifolium]
MGNFMDKKELQSNLNIIHTNFTTDGGTSLDLNSQYKPAHYRKREQTSQIMSYLVGKPSNKTSSMCRKRLDQLNYISLMIKPISDRGGDLDKIRSTTREESVSTQANCNPIKTD